MAEKTPVKCAACGRAFKVSSDLTGKKVRCPCGNVLTVPEEPTADELARKWYYAREGERYGPVPLSELRRLLEEGKLTAEDYVWTKGMPSWKPAGQIEQVQSVLVSPEEAAGEVSEELEESAVEEPAAPAERAAPNYPGAESVQKAGGEQKAAEEAAPSEATETAPTPGPTDTAPAPAAEGEKEPAQVPVFMASCILAIALRVLGGITAGVGIVALVWEVTKHPGRPTLVPASVGAFVGGLLLVGLAQVIELMRHIARETSRIAGENTGST